MATGGIVNPLPRGRRKRRRTAPPSQVLPRLVSVSGLLLLVQCAATDHRSCGPLLLFLASPPPWPPASLRSRCGAFGSRALVAAGEGLSRHKHDDHFQNGHGQHRHRHNVHHSLNQHRHQHQQHPWAVQRVRAVARAEAGGGTSGRFQNGDHRDTRSCADIGKGLQTTTPFLPTFTPLQRIAITATGNLQYLMSSFYCRPVSVICDENVEVRPREYQRKVRLAVQLRNGESVDFCVATSNVTVLDPEVQAAIGGGKVGVGQVFRFFNIMPSFRLLAAGHSEEGFWRKYELSSPRIRCRIHEQFRADTFDLVELRGDNEALCYIPESEDEGTHEAALPDGGLERHFAFREQDGKSGSSG